MFKPHIQEKDVIIVSVCDSTGCNSLARRRHSHVDVYVHKSSSRKLLSTGIEVNFKVCFQLIAHANTSNKNALCALFTCTNTLRLLLLMPTWRLLATLLATQGSSKLLCQLWPKEASSLQQVILSIIFPYKISTEIFLYGCVFIFMSHEIIIKQHHGKKLFSCTVIWDGRTLLWSVNKPTVPRKQAIGNF